MALHLLKLAVGADTVADIPRLQRERRARRRANGEGAGTFHFTRNFPRRADEVLDGGSLYWIVRGEIVARQRILAFEERIRPGKRRRRCAIRLETKLVRTEPLAHRPIQGWRYLRPEDAPPDLGKGGAKGHVKGADRLPPRLARELRELGLL